MASVLVVDDDRTIVRVLEINLAAAGFAVRTASSVSAAVASVRAEPPAAAVVDLGLPDADGADLVDAIRAADAAVAIVVLSGREPDLGDAHGYASRVDAVLRKPADPSDVVETVRRVLADADGAAP